MEVTKDAVDSTKVSIKFFLEEHKIVWLTELVSPVETIPGHFRREPARGGGDSHMKQTGMLVGNLEFNP